MTDKNILTGIFGGTFNPIHNGHLIPLRQAADQVGIDRVGLMPCHIPPHRATPSVSSNQRLEMVRLACQDDPLFFADDCELSRETPSYSVETLKQKKRQTPQQTLCFFMGMDSLKSFNSWYQWQDILSFCHIIVCKRPGPETPYNQPITELLKHKQVQNADILRQTDHGHIYLAETDELDISATQIRALIAKGQRVSKLMPQAVENFIQDHGLYQAQSDKLSKTH